jgi:protease IV
VKRPRWALALIVAVGALVACKPRPRTFSGSEEASTKPSVGEKRVLEIDLGTGAPEVLSGGLFRLPASRTYAGLVRTLEQGLEKDTTAGVLVRFGGANLDLAQAQEIAELLAKYGKKSLPVVCHAEGLSNVTAALVLGGCTRRWLGAAGEAETVGMAAQVVYLRGLLDKLKVEVDFLHVGKFKSGPEPLTHEGPSQEAKESLEFALGSIRQGWLALADKAGPGAKEALETGPFGPEEAKKRGLIDAVGYESDAVADVKRRAKVDAIEVAYGPRAGTGNNFDVSEIVRVLAGGDEADGNRPHVVVVPAQGAISTQAGGAFSSDGITSNAMVKTLRKLGKNAAVKAIVIRIDSPGGSPLASDLIWHELMELRKKKTVIASVGGMAASGGYYIAAGAQKIFAEPGSIVGSIGVFGGKLVLGPALKEVGVNAFTFPASPTPGAGERAAYLSPLVPWNDATRERVRSLMQGIYDLFIARVAEGRKMPAEKVLVSAEGRIWSGPQGLERGLVDELGGLGAAVAAAKKLAGLDAKAPVIVSGQAEGFLEMLSLEEGADEAKIAAALARFDARRSLLLEGLPAELRPFAASLGPLLAGETVVAALPFAVTVR